MVEIPYGLAIEGIEDVEIGDTIGKPDADNPMERLSVDEPTLERLKLGRPKSPQYVHRGGKGAHRFCSRWNLLVPEAVVQRSWEEVEGDR